MKFQSFSVTKKVLGKVLFLLLLAVPLTRCTHSETVKEDPDSLFQQAEEAYKDERYLIAVDRYRDIKNRFPYSARAVDAELRIADAYFEQESYLEAESAYEIFKELHPTHKSDYVQYRIALSYYHQIPDNSARDLSAAYRAIETFQTFLDKYPGSEFAGKAREYIQESRKKLAEHERYVADFYFQRMHYLSASYRYAALLQEFPNLGYDEEALFRLAKCYFQIRMFDNAKDALGRLLSKYPETGFKGEAQAMAEKLSSSKKD